MPFLDDFAESFSRTFSTEGWQTRAERERMGAQTELERERAATEKEHYRTQDDIERERLKLEQEQQPGILAGREAETEQSRQQARLLEQQALDAAWQNDPKQRERDVRETEATIKKLEEEGKLTNAQTQTLLAELPYAAEKVKVAIDNVKAQTADLEADTAKKWIENELLHIETLTPERLLHKQFTEKYGVPEMAAGFKGPQGAIPESETAPEPETPAPAVAKPAEATLTTGGPLPGGVTSLTSSTDARGRPTTNVETTPSPGAPLPTPPVAAPPPISPISERALIDYQSMTREQLAALPPDEYNRYVQLYEADAEAMRSGNASGITPEARVPRSRPTPDVTGAIPTGGAAIQQASYTPSSAGGNVIEAQSGTRRLPLNERTRGMLEQASAATGYDVRVKSGAQESSGPNRTGSHRHDKDVGAGDIELIDRATGKPVSMNTPEGQQKIVEFMRAARDAGATGFGAGTDYMGDTTIHVGFGDPGVWGAGGKGANAPDWLRAGMEGGVSGRPSAIPEGTGARPAGVARTYQGMQQLDMPQMQAAVFAGNIQQESNGDPNSLNEKEGAHGIMQWRGDRWDKLQTYAAEKGTSPNDLQTQLEFAVEEGERLGSGQDKAAWQEFMSATTPEAANAALKKFIRYGDESEGTRLGNAERLLSGGGEEIKGGKRSLSEVTGERMPTPRGEITPQVRRQRIVETSTQAAVEGLKAIYAGVQVGGAVPTQDKQQQLRSIVAGEGAATTKVIADAKQVVQQTFKEPVSEAELNAATLAYAYDLALMKGGEGAKAKAQGLAKEILNSYTRTSNQLSTLAKQQAQNGNLSQAAQLMVKSYAYIPDGKEASIVENEDGSFTITAKDMATDKVVSEQQLSPDEMYAGIMGWGGTTDVHRQLRRAAGETVSSRSFEAGQAQVAQPIEPLPTVGGDFTRQAIPTAIPINPTAYGQGEEMTDVERDDYQAALSARNARIEEANVAAQPPANVDRAAIRSELDELVKLEEEAGPDAQPGTVGHSMQVLRGTYGNKLNSIISNVLQTNPNEMPETVVTDMANMLAASTDERAEHLPMRAERGEYEGTWKVYFAGSPTSYNVPAETAMAIRNGLMGKMKGEQETFGRQFQTYVREGPQRAEAERNRTIAEDAQRKIRERARRGDLRYFPKSAIPGS